MSQGFKIGLRTCELVARPMKCAVILTIHFIHTEQNRTEHTQTERTLKKITIIFPDCQVLLSLTHVFFQVLSMLKLYPWFGSDDQSSTRKWVTGV